MITKIDGAAGAESSPLAQTSLPGGTLGKEEFLKLLVAQMRHQDPLSPMDGKDLAVQLAQFSSVEQLMNLNSSMEAQKDTQAAVVDALNGNSALAAIGRDVLALGDQIVVPRDGTPKEVTFVVGGAGGSATLRIYDANGKEVGSRELGSLVAGRQSTELGSAARGLDPGTYRYEVEVRDGSGGLVPVQTFVTGRADGVRYGNQGPVLTAGPIEIPIGAIVEIVAGS